MYRENNQDGFVCENHPFIFENYCSSIHTGA